LPHPKISSYSSSSSSFFFFFFLSLFLFLFSSFVPIVELPDHTDLEWDFWWVRDYLLDVERRWNINSVGTQHFHIFVDSRAAESDGLVLQEILEKLWHFISPTNLEDQILSCHRGLKDGGALIMSTLAMVGE
jgi:hypothetical protein